MRKHIIFSGKNECSMAELPVEPLADTGVRVKTDLSLLSTGTETIVLYQKYAPGTHWDNWVKSCNPFLAGYTVIGTVTEVGKDVKALSVGNRVVCRKGHGTEHMVADANECYLVPDGIESVDAVWFGLAKIAFMGVHAGKVGLGDRVLIIGGGPIGQMVTRWCAAAGASATVLVDMMPSRLGMATKGGATAVIGKPVDDAKDEILAAFGGLEPNIVIDSTGNAKVFESALGIAGKYATVVVLGDTGTPSAQHLTSDVIGKGLRIVGAHDCHTTTEWPEKRITELFFSLSSAGRFPMDGLLTHTFAASDFRKAYDVVETDRASTMGVIFDWKKL